ncbi:MAG: hypothetical protein ACRCVV_22330 [Shewanella sp.]
MMMKYLTVAKKYGSKVLVGGSALIAAGVQAADQSAIINAAKDDAVANQGLVISAVLGVAVIGFGAYALLKWLGR